MTDTPDSVTDADLWHVEVAQGDVRILTVEQLDDAFQRDVINEETRVWQEGLPSAIRLGDLLGDDDDSDDSENTPVAARAAAPAAQPAMEAYRAPSKPREPMHRGAQDTLIGLSPYELASDEQPQAQSYLPQAQSYPPQARSYPPQAAASAPQAPSYPPQAVVNAPQSRAPHGAWSPPAAVAGPAHAPLATGPQGLPSQPPPVAPSIAPLAFDIDDDIVFARASRGSKKVFVVFGGLIAAAAVAVVALNVGGIATAGSPPPAEEKPVPAAQPFGGHGYDPGNAPVKLGEAAPRQDLTVRDHQAGTEETSAAPTQHTARRTRRTFKRKNNKPHKTDSTYKSKGKANTYDPLNGSL